jgi:hypothetical protein
MRSDAYGDGDGTGVAAPKQVLMLRHGQGAHNLVCPGPGTCTIQRTAASRTAH